MRLTLPRHRFTLVLPALVVILLAVGAWAMYPRASANQTPAPAEGQGFLKSARRAIAHGRISEAESMAKARPGSDSGAAAVLAELAIRRGKYEEAQALLEPAAAKEPEGEAALALGILHLQLGRAQEGSRLLTAVQRQASSRSDAESLFRAARAAQALSNARGSEWNLPRGFPPATIRRSIQAGDCCSSKSISAAKRCARSRMR